MKYFIFSILFLSSLLIADKQIKVVTSTTDLAWAAKQIGKDYVEVTPLLSGTENPHYVDTVPDYIRLAADADIVCSVGMELEIGWMPKVLARSGNAQVQMGGKGFCELGKSAPVLEKPQGNIDRSMGDIHPAGNPHFWLSPHAFAESAKEIRDALVRVDAIHASAYLENCKTFSDRLEKLVQQNKARIQPLLAKTKAPQVIEYHKEFTYFFNVYGITSIGSIEEKPGVPPSAGRIADISVRAKTEGVRAAWAGEYVPHKTMERFTELSGIPSVIVATSVQPKGKTQDYIELHNLLVENLIKALSRETK